MAKRKGTLCETEEMLDTAESRGLPHLQPKQLAFVLGLCDGLSAYESYCQSYDTSGGHAARVHSTQLLQDDKIACWLKTARELALSTGMRSLEGHWQELEGLARRAENAGNYGAAAQLLIHKGKSQGHYVEQTRDMTDRDDEAVLERARALFGPDIERAFKEQLSGKPTSH